MRKILLMLLLFPAFSLFAQNFTVTPEGLRDATDLEKSYIVLDFEGVSVMDLYEKSLGFINEHMKNPKESIKAQAEDEYLRFSTFRPNVFKYNNSGAKFPVDFWYDTELRFKDGKIRYEITDLRMETEKYPVPFSGSKWSTYPVYERNGKLFKESAKKEIEDYFNVMIKIFQDYINGDLKDEDW
jgi:hypothetical protein